MSQSDADRDLATVDVFVGDNVDVATEMTIMLYSQAPPHSVTVNNGQTSTQPILVAGTAYRIMQFFKVSPGDEDRYCTPSRRVKKLFRDNAVFLLLLSFYSETQYFSPSSSPSSFFSSFLSIFLVPPPQKGHNQLTVQFSSTPEPHMMEVRAAVKEDEEVERVSVEFWASHDLSFLHLDDPQDPVTLYVKVTTLLQIS